MDIDPAARILADNLHRAAADAESTRNLPKIPTHEELLNGKQGKVITSPSPARS
jgi:hypothetical protein